MWKILSVLCYIFGVADLFLFYAFDVDLTGLSWSPIIAFILGSVFGAIGKDD